MDRGTGAQAAPRRMAAHKRRGPENSPPRASTGPLNEEVGRLEAEAIPQQLLGMVDGDHHAPARVGGRTGAVLAAEGAGVRAERELLGPRARLQRELDVAAVAA